MPPIPDIPLIPPIPPMPDIPLMPPIPLGRQTHWPPIPDIPPMPPIPDIPDIPPMPFIPDIPPMPFIPDIPDIPPMPFIPDMPYMLAETGAAIRVATTAVKPNAFLIPLVKLCIRILLVIANTPSIVKDCYR